MTILYISYDGAADNLGQSQIIPYISGLSKKDNLEFVLLTFEKKKALQNKKLVSSINKGLCANGITWIFLKYHKTPALIATIYDLLQGVITGSLLIKNKRIEIIHGRTFVGSLIALFLKNIFRIKVILDVRGFWPEERVEAGLWRKNGQLYKISKLIEKALMVNADEIVILTLNGKKELENSGYLVNRKININVIPTCVDVNAPIVQTADDAIVNNLKSNNRFVIAYIGSASTWYMPIDMFNFFNVAQTAIPGSSFLVLTNEEEFLRNILQKRTGKKNDIAIRNVEHKFVSYYLSVAKVGLAFYRPGYSRKACSPTKIGEYLAQGLPVIINAGVGDCDEIILKEKVGVLINEFSLGEYERAVRELKELMAEGDSLKERCKASARKYYSLDMGIERYWDIYRGFIEKRKAN